MFRKPKNMAERRAAAALLDDEDAMELGVKPRRGRTRESLPDSQDDVSRGRRGKGKKKPFRGGKKFFFEMEEV